MHSLPPTAIKRAIPVSKSQMASLSQIYNSTMNRPNAAPTSNIGVDENSFIESFENVPRIQLYTSREVEQYLSQINECLADTNHDWEKRVESLKRLRSLTIFCTSTNQYEDEFFTSLKTIHASMTAQVKDLRSQIVREACITIAFLSQKMRIKFDSFAEAVMNHLLNLIQNSAKVISTSGIVAARFIVDNTHSPRLIPLIINVQLSKSKEIRRYSYELLNQLLTVWETPSLEKHVTIILGSLKKGVNDADQDARSEARKAFWSFHAHFPKQAKLLLETFDLRTQKSLNMGNQTGSIKNLKGTFQSTSFDAPAESGPKPNSVRGTIPSPRIARSTSVNDMKNPRSTSVKTATRIPMSNSIVTPSKITNTKTPKLLQSRIAVSQPGSRSTSPTNTPKFAHKVDYFKHYQPNQTIDTVDTIVNQQTVYSKITLDSSIESSPDKASDSSINFNYRKSPEKSVENLASSTNRYSKTNKRLECGETDEASETSSICSDRSFTSSLGGLKINDLKDLNEMLSCLTSQQWSERRRGIQTLTGFMQNGRVFNRLELKRLTDIFTRLFQDPHGQVFILFLDALSDFIEQYKRDLNDWLYALLTRLLARLGNETLPSVYQKLCKCVEVVFSSFDVNLQFNALIKQINDKTQAQNLKVKTVLLQYLQDVICLMETCDFHKNNELRFAVSRIVSLTAEPKSVDIRRTAQAVLIALFNLNTPDFSQLLVDLPKSIQETARQIIENHLKNINPTSKPDTDNRASKGLSFMTPSNSDYMLTNEILDQSFDDMSSNYYMDNKLNKIEIDAMMESLISPQNNNKLMRALDDLCLFIKNSEIFENFKWSENFHSILRSLFEHLKNTENSIQTKCLLALRELLQYQTKEFTDFIEFTIYSLIENCKDQASDMPKLYEDVLYTAAIVLPREATIKVLKPLIETAEYPKNLIALRMLQKVLENSTEDICRKILMSILNTLLSAWDSPQSAVRKAAVFCLVEMYLKIGDELKSHFNNLSASKIKLLNVYINRATEINGS